MSNKAKQNYPPPPSLAGKWYLVSRSAGVGNNGLLNLSRNCLQHYVLDLDQPLFHTPSIPTHPPSKELIGTEIPK